MVDEIRMMTYAEAGRILGIKPDSVARRARNRHWKKELGNDGLARVGVPVVAIPSDNPEEVLPDVTPEIRRQSGPDAEALARIAALETEVRMLREAADELRQDRDAWREMAQRPWWQAFIRRSRG